MAVERTSRDIRAYNIFKLVVTLILIVIIIIIVLLLRARTGVAPVAQIVEPTVTMAAPVMFGPQIGDDGTLTLSGTGTPGSTVSVWARAGELLGQAAVGADGTWSFVAAPLDPGDYDFSARAVDASGVTIAVSEPFAVPSARPVLVSPQAGDRFTGDTLTLEGTGQPGAEIEILDNGKVVGKAIVQADGTWKFDGEFVSGLHALTVQNVGDVESAGDAVVVEMVAAVQPAPAAGMCGTDAISMGIDRGTTYIVARCEHMALIARRTGVTLADLIAVNPQVANPNLIYPNQVLNLPPR